MEINAIMSGQSGGAAATQPQTSAVLTSDFETFLQMLTTQARYQDPLEPIDSSEYAAQLAQFSMVEQQVKANELLEALTTQLGSGSIGQMAGWIGLEARTAARVPFEGAAISVDATAAPGADAAHLVVYDASGNQVQKLPIALAENTVDWQGRKNDGSVFASGLYSFAVESSAVGTVIATQPAETYARIVEARRDGDDTRLVLSGGSSVLSQDITALRAPL